MKPLNNYKREDVAELADLIFKARLLLSLIKAKQEGLIAESIFLYGENTHETLVDALKYELQDNIDYTFTEENLDSSLTLKFFNDANAHIKNLLKID